MLQIAPIKAVPGDFLRKWMTDDYFDLYVWYEDDGSIHGFQLCYDKAGDPRALTWVQNGTMRHQRIDDGEDSPEANRSPILTQSCPFERVPLRTAFLTRTVEIEREIRALVLAKIDAFADSEGKRHQGTGSAR
jgi:hypothetical protein